MVRAPLTPHGAPPGEGLGTEPVSMGPDEFAPDGEPPRGPVTSRTGPPVSSMPASATTMTRPPNLLRAVSRSISISSRFAPSRRAPMAREPSASIPATNDDYLVGVEQIGVGTVVDHPAVSRSVWDRRGEHAPFRTDTRLTPRPGRSDRRSRGLGPATQLSLRCGPRRAEYPRRSEQVRRRRPRTKPRRRPGRVGPPAINGGCAGSGRPRRWPGVRRSGCSTASSRCARGPRKWPGRSARHKRRDERDRAWRSRRPVR